MPSIARRVKWSDSTQGRDARTAQGCSVEAVSDILRGSRIFEHIAVLLKSSAHDMKRFRDAPLRARRTKSPAYSNIHLLRDTAQR
jgi:hypothetical protein